LLEFRDREGRDPDIDHADADADKLKQIAAEVLKSLGVNEDFLDLDFTVYALHLIQVQLTMICYDGHVPLFKNNMCKAIHQVRFGMRMVRSELLSSEYNFIQSIKSLEKL